MNTDQNTNADMQRGGTRDGPRFWRRMFYYALAAVVAGVGFMLFAASISRLSAPTGSSDWTFSIDNPAWNQGHIDAAHVLFGIGTIILTVGVLLLIGAMAVLNQITFEVIAYYYDRMEQERAAAKVQTDAGWESGDT